MSTKKLSVLGATGSIGRQALSLVEDLGIKVTSISGYRNAALLEEQALRHKPKYVCAVDAGAATHLKVALAPTDIKVLGGADELARMAAEDGSDTVLTAIVGIAGLLPTIAAIRAGKNIALANKETLVAGGQLVTDLAREHNVRLLPVDSEHSAVFQCLQDACARDALVKIMLTASGGPFFGYTRDQLRDVTPEQALRHPNWTMGRKITIDSATMMNKGLELIEAMWLFDLAPRDIEIAVHRQSIVHSMVELRDGSVLAQLGPPDMRTPIQYALTWPGRMPGKAKRLTLEDMRQLTFEPVDEQAFGCLAACRQAAETGGTAPCVANAANEQAVELFLQGNVGFLDIERAIRHALETTAPSPTYTVEQLLDTDRAVRTQTKTLFNL